MESDSEPINPISNCTHIQITSTVPSRLATSKSLKSSLSRNLLRCAKWSSDGSTILSEAEDRVIRLFDCPPPVAESSEDTGARLHEEWKPRREITAADAVLSTCWFPHSRSDDPARFCFATAVKDHPIHLLDATDGRLRASYPLVDHRERMVAPHSMLFSQDGTSLYASHQCAIEIFDISRPGCPGERYKTSPTRRSRDGQKGIISTLAADPISTGLLAAGSFSGQIGIYDTLASELSPQMIFHSAEHTGITQVKFHLLNERVLFTASRRSNLIKCWDLRYAAACFHTFHRPGHTNQRLSFDIDYSGLNLATGAQDGKIRVYRLDNLDSAPASKMTLHSDVIGSVAFNPAGCSIASCSGSRKNKFDESHDENVENINGIDAHHDLNGGLPERKNDTELAIWKFDYV